jgi:two-component system chemotaxis response regulator CheY
MNPRVLVIDDSVTLRQQVRVALTEAGFEVLEATDGVEGLAQIAAERDLSAVICDQNMPRMTGIEMLEQCNLQGGLQMPVLMLTTEGEPSLIQRAKQCGAKGWIVKPFKMDLLVAAIRQLTQAA